MTIKMKKASEGKIFAYLDEEGNEIRLGSILYLGVDDDGERYYQIDENEIPEDMVDESEKQSV